jgi:hypothetical protein
MLRQIPIALLAVWLAGGVNAPDGAAPADPPSSLDPAAARSKLSLHHAHARVRACERSIRKGTVMCTADKEPADASATVRLLPVKNPRIAGEDKRETREVALGGNGTLDEALELGAGVWELDWTDAARRARFELVAGDELMIRLESVSGACRTIRRECSLVAGVTTRKILLPGGRAR